MTVFYIVVFLYWINFKEIPVANNVSSSSPAACPQEEVKSPQGETPVHEGVAKNVDPPVHVHNFFRFTVNTMRDDD